MMDYGQWYNTPDYREGWQDPHASGIARLTKALDPATMIPGWGQAVAQPMHDLAIQGADIGNRALSPIVGGAQDFTNVITPGLKQAEKSTGMSGIQNFIRNKPVDAAAIAAATFFSGGGATSGLSGAPAASTTGGAGGLYSAGAAGTEAITPAFESGAASGLGTGTTAGTTTGSLAGANAITPTFASGSYPGIAGASAPGMLGTAGTAAANSALTPSFMGSGSALGNTFNTLKTANNYRKNLSNFSTKDNSNEVRQQNDNAVVENMLNNNEVPKFKLRKIIDQLAMQQGY